MVLGLQPPYPFDANVHGSRSPRWGVRRVPTSLPVGGPHKGSGGTAFAEGQKGGAGFASEILTHRTTSTGEVFQPPNHYPLFFSA